jgi:hypothetical protein
LRWLLQESAPCGIAHSGGEALGGLQLLKTFVAAEEMLLKRLALGRRKSVPDVPLNGFCSFDLGVHHIEVSFCPPVYQKSFCAFT